MSLGSYTTAGKFLWLVVSVVIFIRRVFCRCFLKKSHTLTIMANADRIGRSFVKKFGQEK